MKAEQYWVVIPAAGVGKRMLVDQPKQYLPLCGKTVIEHTLGCFGQDSRFSGIVVAISSGDEYWQSLALESQVPLYETEGGEERCFSVLNGLRCLQSLARETDWVLVHDAARPCLRRTDLDHLIQQLGTHSVGGLLGLPVADTLKLCGGNQRVKRTVDRSGLWRALTPQMFRYGKLLAAMEAAVQHPQRITDEASAMEMAGYEPVMVEGSWDNIKITHPQDLKQAEMILRNRSR